jgi:hypothetical protein
MDEDRQFARRARGIEGSISASLLLVVAAVAPCL